MTNLFGLLALFLVATSTALGQGGSFYSVYGMGDVRRSVGALYEGMAGTSIALPSDHGINIVNPALQGMSTYTRLQTGYRFSQHQNTLGTASLAQNNGEIDGLMAMFSVDTAAGVGITLGLVPYSTVNYLAEQPLQRVVDGRTVTGRSTRIGEGGVSAIVLGSSWRPDPSLYIGASVQPLFGTITLTDQVTIAGEGNLSMTQIISYDVRGVLFRAGIYWAATNDLSVGAVMSAGGDGSVVSSFRAAGFRPGAISFDTITTRTSSSGLPVTFGLGLNYALGRTRLAADVELADYSNVRVHNVEGVTLGTALRTTVGITRPGSTTVGADFFDRVGLHAGAGFQQSYFRVNGQQTTEVFGSAGFDFPLGGAATVDAAIQGGLRSGITGGLEDLFMRMFVTLSIGEVWFKPFARD